MNNEKIKTYLLDFQERSFLNIKKREVYLKDNSSKIQTVIGARRVGKTYLLFNKIVELRNIGVSKKQIIYLNFENPILYDISYKEIKEILEIYFSLFPDCLKNKLYLFIDEPQVIDKWEIAIRNIYDDFDINIFLTGSSSRLLSKEISTSLRGRSIPSLLLSLSFLEFLNFKNFDFDIKQLTTAKKSKIKNYFEEFLNFGAYPEVVLEEDENEKLKIIKDYFDLTLYKDIIERYKIKNTELIKILIEMILASCSREFSLNKHFLDLKSRGLKFGKATLYEYFSSLKDCFFVFSVKKFYFSKKSENLSIPKVYLGDIGFLSLFSLQNIGQRFENIVFLQLHRKTNNNPLLKINYWQSDKNNLEVDFLIREGNDIKQAIQVCYDLKDLKTKQREINGLMACMEELKLKQALVITNDFEGEEIIENKKIIYIKLWKWLLEN